MRYSITNSRWTRMAGTVALAAAALGVGAIGSTASACGDRCGYGYYAAPAYYAPAVYAYVAPVPVAVVAVPTSYAYVPVYRPAYYAPVNAFRGPRWGYAAAYYNPRVVCRRVNPCGRGYVAGPVVRAGWWGW